MKYKKLIDKIYELCPELKTSFVTDGEKQALVEPVISLHYILKAMRIEFYDCEELLHEWNFNLEDNLETQCKANPELKLFLEEILL